VAAVGLALLLCALPGRPGSAEEVLAPADPAERPVDPTGLAADPAERVWEVNGIRLERGQVDRLATDMARRTVAAVERKVPGIALRPEQRDAMLAIYRDVALGVFDRVVGVVDSDLSDAEKEKQVRELVLEGQRLSHERLASVLDARQMPQYTLWEDEQVRAYKSARWDRRRRGRR
jgi:hypothetical protein